VAGGAVSALVVAEAVAPVDPPAGLGGAVELVPGDSASDSRIGEKCLRGGVLETGADPALRPA